jgi:deoxyribose-phosphate aldolase
MADADTARRVLRCLDLTDLSDNCSDHAIDALCARAVTPLGPAAAVCVWPQLVGRAREALEGSPVRVATVVNFPAGGEDVERIVEDTGGALEDGAGEIDLVLPYRAFLRGEPAIARDMVAGVRDMVDQGRPLKVILETGMLPSPRAIAEASRLAIEAGADFLKTSTGKVPISATPEAVEIMLTAIREAGRPVGLKVSGGIRTLRDAALYMALADGMMGPDWATPQTFRIGASTLYDALLAAIEGGKPAPPPELAAY